MPSGAGDNTRRMQIYRLRLSVVDGINNGDKQPAAADVGSIATLTPVDTRQIATKHADQQSVRRSLQTPTAHFPVLFVN